MPAPAPRTLNFLEQGNWRGLGRVRAAPFQSSTSPGQSPTSPSGTSRTGGEPPATAGPSLPRDKALVAVGRSRPDSGNPLAHCLCNELRSVVERRLPRAESATDRHLWPRRWSEHRSTDAEAQCEVARMRMVREPAHASTASTGLRAEYGSEGPYPNRITISGRRPGKPTSVASSGRRLATSTGWLMKACLRPSAVASNAKRWQARPAKTQCSGSSLWATNTATPAVEASCPAPAVSGCSPRRS